MKVPTLSPGNRGYDVATITTRCVAVIGAQPSDLILYAIERRNAYERLARDRRDALELMLRVFDREGLALLPALQLASPLPELEKLRRGSDPQVCADRNAEQGARSLYG